MNELYLQHHGILGQKWGVRRFQNPDGTRTAEGKKRYSSDGEVGKSDKSKISINKDTAKKIAIGAGTALTLAAATYAYAKNKDVVDLAVQTAITKLKVNGAIIEAGVKNNMLTKDIIEKNKVFKTKVAEGKKTVDKLLSTSLGRGVKKVAGAALEGTGVMLGTMALNKAIGEDTTADLMDSKNAYTKKDDRIKYKTVNDAITSNVKKVAKDEAKKNPRAKKILNTMDKIK